jgi:hypothetical protein
VLEFTGHKTKTLTGINFDAKNADGKSVVVRVSTEALQERTEGDCLAMSEHKYDNGLLEQDGNVWVRAGDFT